MLHCTNGKRELARKFLYVMVGLIVLATAGMFAYRFYGVQILRMALVPGASFRDQPAPAPNAYADPAMWLARPDIPNNPALWTPEGHAPDPKAPAAVFFVHPTSYINRATWNAPLDDRQANDLAATFLRGQASAFNAAGAIWAPRYRQATFGAFLTSRADGEKSLDLAYRDVLAAFGQFLKDVGPDRPIILAGHSQGALHLMRLLREQVAGKPLAARIVAAYVVGWPVSRVADLPHLGLPECASADQSGCILSWQSFAEPADPAMILDIYDASTSPEGIARKGTAMICTNPLTGTPDADAPASANLGTLIPARDLKSATIAQGSVPAKCTPRGFLSIGAPVQMGGYVLPGNNYHVFDYSLFWANVRADAARRLAAFRSKARAAR